MLKRLVRHRSDQAHGTILVPSCHRRTGELIQFSQSRVVLYDVDDTVPGIDRKKNAGPFFWMKPRPSSDPGSYVSFETALGWQWMDT